MKNSLVNIRFASDEDARDILEILYSAVHITAARDYTEAMRNAWAPPVTEERIERYRRDSLPKETTLVAEVNGKVVGFGSIIECKCELYSLYVSSDFGSQRIGSALLHALEELAQERGCRELHMNSSLTAEVFYKQHGYLELERSEYALSGAYKVPCVRMCKAL